MFIIFIHNKYVAVALMCVHYCLIPNLFLMKIIKQIK